MLVRVCVTVRNACCVELRKKACDMFCLHETLKKQTAQEIIRETVQRSAESLSRCGKMFPPVKICLFPGGRERMRRRSAAVRRQGWYM